VAVLAADQNAAHGSLIADAGRQMPAGEFGRRAVGQIRAVPLTGMDDEHVGGSAGLEDAPGGLDDCAQQRNVVAERFAETTRIDEVALHVDDDQRRRARLERELIWLRGNSRHRRQCPLLFV
jgi:hypothetical protein